MLEQVTFAGRVGLKDASLCQDSRRNARLGEARSPQQKPLNVRPTLGQRCAEVNTPWVGPNRSHRETKGQLQCACHACLTMCLGMASPSYALSGRTPYNVNPFQVDQDFCWVCVCLRAYSLHHCILVWLGSRLAFGVSVHAHKSIKDSPMQFAQLMGMLEQTHQGRFPPAEASECAPHTRPAVCRSKHSLGRAKPLSQRNKRATTMRMPCMPDYVPRNGITFVCLVRPNPIQCQPVSSGSGLLLGMFACLQFASLYFGVAGLKVGFRCLCACPQKYQGQSNAVRSVDGNA